ncbi:RNA-binding, RBD [Glarea lozoyensis ATCC 20868]|uniref:RNA-binding, RBD n=1 Tax=Glarea lozoyensis (strain ATCC 20868 / MF5171) TaxID=1116229 RepID=S3DTH7_GLAL2|nr:RNA-binding, RBD [Glarea lozoyensis ATCC 20868]EPE29713.1 RNA-binding, RBD [Glarea lozoyensis ATCC 20868]
MSMEPSTSASVPPPLPPPRHISPYPTQMDSFSYDASLLNLLQPGRETRNNAGMKRRNNELESGHHSETSMLQPNSNNQLPLKHSAYTNSHVDPPKWQRRQNGARESDEFIPTAVVIKNIPFAFRKEQFIALVSEMRLPLPYALNYHFDKGVFRGLAFANFSSAQETRLFIDSMNEREVQGRRLRVEHKSMLPVEERERIERAKREWHESLPQMNQLSKLHRTRSTSELFGSRVSASRQSPVTGTYSGYASSNHSDISIRSFGSNNSYTCSVRSARGIPDADSEILSPVSNGVKGRQSSAASSDTPHCVVDNTRHTKALPSEELVGLEGKYQSWETFCVWQLVAFLQVCTLSDVHALTQSPIKLKDRFKSYLRRMIAREGNTDFLLYRAFAQPGQPEAQLQMLRHLNSTFSQSRSSIRSYSSRTSHSSASSASSFSSQISDGTLLNHVQQEAKSLKDCLIKIQKKLKHLEKGLEGIQNDKSQETPAAESITLVKLVDANKIAIEWLNSKDGELGLLGFSDMSLLFAKFHRDFADIYKDLKSLKRQNKLQKVFRPGRSKKEVEERRLKYAHIDQAVYNMMSGIVSGFEAAELQKAAFVAAGQSCVSVSISETAADLGYAAYDTTHGMLRFLEMREFFKIEDSRFRNYFKCNCCPKKPKSFDTKVALRAHENENPYQCTYCPRRFRSKNNAEVHSNSLHTRRFSWSCAGLISYEAAFHPASRTPDEADICGYCGEEFRRSGPVDDLGIKTTSEADLELRIVHLQETHKFGECNRAKKFFRADHFKQHNKHSHAGIIGTWTSMLDNACMKDELLSKPICGPNGEYSHTEDGTQLPTESHNVPEEILLLAERIREPVSPSGPVRGVQKRHCRSERHRILD